MARLPMYQVIEDDLAADIESGLLGPSAKLPSEHELARKYGVSRMTVRQALDRLESAHLLVRQRGSGNYVSPHVGQGRLLGRLNSFIAELGPGGHEVVTTPLILSTEPAPPHVQRKLRLGDDQPVTRYLRARRVDGRPAALQDSWIPYSVAPGLARDGILDDSLYATLRGRYQIELRWAEQEMLAVDLTAEQSERLAVEGGPALMTRRTTFGAGEIPVEYAESVTVPQFPLTIRIEA